MKRFTWLLACLLIFSPLYVHAAKSRKASGTKNGGNKKSFVWVKEHGMDALAKINRKILSSCTQKESFIFSSNLYANAIMNPDVLLGILIGKLNLVEKENYKQMRNFILHRMNVLVVSQGEKRFDFLMDFIKAHYCYENKQEIDLTFKAYYFQYCEVYWLLDILLHLEGKEEQKNEAKIFADEICKNYESMKRILFKKLKK